MYSDEGWRKNAYKGYFYYTTHLRPVPHRHPTPQPSAPACTFNSRHALIAWAALAMFNASAQDTGTAVVAQVQSLDRLEAEQARLRKLMELSLIHI